MQNNKKVQKLVVGCGIKKLEGYWNVDINPDVHPDEIVDITKKLTYKDNQFQEIICEYMLCQICNKEDFKKAMNNLWKILSPDEVLKIKVPNAKFPVVFKDPFDCRYFTEETFDFFNYKHYRHKVFPYGFLPWKIIKIKKISGPSTPNIKDRLLVEMSPYKKNEQN